MEAQLKALAMESPWWTWDENAHEAYTVVTFQQNEFPAFRAVGHLMWSRANRKWLCWISGGDHALAPEITGPTAYEAMVAVERFMADLLTGNSTVAAHERYATCIKAFLSEKLGGEKALELLDEFNARFGPKLRNKIGMGS